MNAGAQSAIAEIPASVFLFYIFCSSVSVTRLPRFHPFDPVRTQRCRQFDMCLCTIFRTCCFNYLRKRTPPKAMNEINEKSYLSKQPYDKFVHDFSEQESHNREDTRSTRQPPIMNQIAEHDFHSIYDI